MRHILTHIYRHHIGNICYPPAIGAITSWVVPNWVNSDLLLVCMISRCFFPLLFLPYSSVRSRLQFTQTDSCCGVQQCVYCSTSPLSSGLMIPRVTWGMKNQVRRHNRIKEEILSTVTPLNWIVILQFSSLRSVSIAISSLTRGSGEPCTSEAKLPEAQSCSIFPERKSVLYSGQQSSRGLLDYCSCIKSQAERVSHQCW